MCKGAKTIFILMLLLFTLLSGYGKDNLNNSSCQTKTVEGRVVETDWVSSALVIESLGNNYTFKVPKSAKIINGSETVNFSDVEASDPVSVEYYEDNNGSLIVKNITLKNVLGYDW